MADGSRPLVVVVLWWCRVAAAGALMLTAVIQLDQMAQRRRMQQVAYEVVSALSIRIDGYQRRFCLKLARHLDPIMPYAWQLSPLSTCRWAMTHFNEHRDMVKTRLL